MYVDGANMDPAEVDRRSKRHHPFVVLGGMWAFSPVGRPVW